MGVGHAKGEKAAVTAMKAAIDSKLLEENSITGAKGALINITCDENTPLNELEDAIALIYEEADEDANIIFGTVFDDKMQGEVKITVIATGFSEAQQAQKVPEAFGGATPVSGQLPVVNQVQNQPVAQQHERNGTTGTSRIEDMEIPTFIRKKMD
jgi:cell division protein FtsZ